MSEPEKAPETSIRWCDVAAAMAKEPTTEELDALAGSVAPPAQERVRKLRVTVTEERYEELLILARLEWDTVAGVVSRSIRTYVRAALAEWADSHGTDLDVFVAGQRNLLRLHARARGERAEGERR